MKTATTLLWLALAWLAASCGGSYTPKPRGFNRIDLPKQSYQLLDAPDLPYHFEYSDQAVLSPDTTGFTGDHWVDLRYPIFGASVQLTYYPLLRNQALFYELLEDAYTLTNKHQIKASAIDRVAVANSFGNQGLLFLLKGEVPSQVQFLVTDSTDHFLRGALYFKMADKNDSLAPVIQFIQQDIVHMVQTTRWKQTTKK
jgi:gliding motility-associated lipoprotein GldD